LSRRVVFLARLPQVPIEHQRRVPGREPSRKSAPHRGPAHSRTRVIAADVTRSRASRAIRASVAVTGSAARHWTRPDASRLGTGTGSAAARLALVLRSALPTRAPSTGLSYGRLLRTTVHLVRVHAPLRRRALYQAAMLGMFSAFWTTISFVLTGPPFHYSQLGVGLFALVGAGGALIASWAGRWADRGLTRPMTAVAFVVAALSFGVAGVGRHSVILLAVAAILIDMAVQTTLVLGQHAIYALDPTARARLNSAYIATLFLGGAVGSQLGSVAYHEGGWTALVGFGAALPVLPLLAWCTERRVNETAPAG
jgi:predicted MFS family arabinose efflux permease